MRLCIVGRFSREYLDEGYRNIAYYLSKELSEMGHDVLGLDVKKMYSINFWRKMKNFEPQIIHLLTAPTFVSFFVLKSLNIYCNDAKTVMSSLHPYPLTILKSFLSRTVIFSIKPDLILTQSLEVENFLKINCNTEYLPNGVDTERFVPVSKETKEKLRKKYGVNKEKFVVLHVGHIRQVRNLQILNKIQKEDKNSQVIIVGSLRFKRDEKLYKDLMDNGCIVWNSYFEDIEEIYALSDCYVFPVMKENSIFMPLSVMEAMSCNLPVISTKFEGLTRTFEEGGGLIFAEREEDFNKGLEEIKTSGIQVKTREKVLPYSWEKIVKKLESIYESSKGYKMKKMGGIFICFTGIDGAGKTSLSKELIKLSREKKIKCRYVYARRNSFILKPFILIGRLMFLRERNISENYLEYANTKKKAMEKHSFLSRVYQQIVLLDYSLQVLFKIKLPLIFGKNIVCDRYIYDKVITDLSVDMNYSENKVISLLNNMLHFLPKPNIVFLMDLPEEIAYQRKDDTPSIKYLKDRRKIYLEVGEIYKMKVLDGCKSMEELKSEIEEVVFQ